MGNTQCIVVRNDEKMYSVQFKKTSGYNDWNVSKSFCSMDCQKHWIK